ncbi:hypothetical protein JCM24511_07981 [Saitozyma sp. JCM 24511]|nr:hypothetical protein JCM24511_07981 [Saitozyma sp. JCM 24511]
MQEVPATQVTSRDSAHPRYGSDAVFTPTLFMTSRPAKANNSDWITCRSAVVVEHDDTNDTGSDDAWSSHPEYLEASDLSRRLHEGISDLMKRRSKLPDNTLDSIVMGLTAPVRALFSAEARQDLVDLTNPTAYGPLRVACTDQLNRMTKEDPKMGTCQIVWSEWSEFEDRFPVEAASIDEQLAKQSSSG